MSRKIKKWSLHILVWIAGLGVWHLLSLAYGPDILPGPIYTAKGGYELLTDGTLIQYIGISSYRAARLDPWRPDCNSGRTYHREGGADPRFRRTFPQFHPVHSADCLHHLVSGLVRHRGNIEGYAYSVRYLLHCGIKHVDGCVIR